MDYLRKRIPMIVKQCEDMSTYGCHVYVSITPSRVFQILKASFDPGIPKREDVFFAPVSDCKTFPKTSQKSDKSEKKDTMTS